jgi:hypothetical protein
VVHGKAEEDVVLDGTLLDPWRLRYVGCSPAHFHLQVAIAESINDLNRWRFPIAPKKLRERNSTLPVVLCISPSKAASSDVFPDPTYNAAHSQISVKEETGIFCSEEIMD